MEIQKLEKAVLAAVQMSPRQPALATLASGGHGSAELPREFDSAVKSLTRRMKIRVKQEVADHDWW